MKTSYLICQNIYILSFYRSNCFQISSVLQRKKTNDEFFNPLYSSTNSNEYEFGDSSSLPPPDMLKKDDGPKEALLAALDNQQRNNEISVAGFGASDSDKSRIVQLANELLDSNYVLPLSPPSEWNLLYNDAPDILGFRGGPLSKLVSIRQKVISPQRLEILLEYQPSDGMTTTLSNIANVLSFLPQENVQEDRLEQTVLFDYERKSMNMIDLTIKGTKIDSSRFGSIPTIEGPGSLPFGSYRIVFNDDDLCIQKTVQGDFIFIYQRIS